MKMAKNVKISHYLATDAPLGTLMAVTEQRFTQILRLIADLTGKGCVIIDYIIPIGAIVYKSPLKGASILIDFGQLPMVL